MNSVVAARLREAVKHAGGNKEVAERSGVKLGTLNNYLREVHRLPADAASKIAVACGINVEWLLTGSGPKRVGEPFNVEAVLSALPPRAADPGAPFHMFSTIDMDVLAEAVGQADKMFTASKGAPTLRERAQAIALIYDMISSFDQGRRERDSNLGK